MKNYMMAEEYYNRGELLLARFYYKQALMENPDNKEMMMKFLDISFLLGNKEDLLKYIEEAKIKFSQEYFPYHLEYYLSLIDDEEMGDNFLESLNDKFYACMEYQYDRFIYYLCHDQEMKSIAIAENYLVNNEKAYLTICNDLAELYFKIGEYEKCEKVYMNAHNKTNNDVYIVKIMEMKIATGDFEGAREIAISLKKKNESLFKIVGMLIEAVLEVSVDIKNTLLEEIIVFCKLLDIEYPARAYTDLISAICYFIQGRKDKAVEILEFIENIADSKVEECEIIRKIMNDTSDDNKEVVSIDMLIWRKMLEVYIRFIGKA